MCSKYWQKRFFDEIETNKSPSENDKKPGLQWVLLLVTCPLPVALVPLHLPARDSDDHDDDVPNDPDDDDDVGDLPWHQLLANRPIYRRYYSPREPTTWSLLPSKSSITIVWDDLFQSSERDNMCFFKKSISTTHLVTVVVIIINYNCLGWFPPIFSMRSICGTFYKEALLKRVYLNLAHSSRDSVRLTGSPSWRTTSLSPSSPPTIYGQSNQSIHLN